VKTSILILRSAKRVSKDEARTAKASWFETPRCARLLIMRVETVQAIP
jgi:hypothetical protein